MNAEVEKMDRGGELELAWTRMVEAHQRERDRVGKPLFDAVDFVIAGKPSCTKIAPLLVECLWSIYSGEDQHPLTAALAGILEAYCALEGVDKPEGKVCKSAWDSFDIENMGVIQTLTDAWKTSIQSETDPSRLQLLKFILKRLKKWHRDTSHRQRES